MKILTLIFKIILLAGLILSDNPVLSQGKFEVSGGFGWPERINLKIKYGNDIQIGTSLGFLPGKGNYNIGPFTADIYYHFSGKSELVDQRPWYLLGSLGYGFGDIYFCPRVGRTFNFYKKLGINFDAGAFLPFNKELRDFLDSPVYPSGSISFFVRL
jgi:hypothetical protein